MEEKKFSIGDSVKITFPGGLDVTIIGKIKDFKFDDGKAFAVISIEGTDIEFPTQWCEVIDHA